MLEKQTVAEQVAKHLREELKGRRWSGAMPRRDVLACELGVHENAIERVFFEELEKGVIPHSFYDLPTWDISPEELSKCLDSLFQFTPPTSILVDDWILVHAIQNYFCASGQGLPQPGLRLHRLPSEVPGVSPMNRPFLPGSGCRGAVRRGMVETRRSREKCDPAKTDQGRFPRKPDERIAKHGMRLVDLGVGDVERGEFLLAKGSRLEISRLERECADHEEGEVEAAEEGV